MAENDVIGLSVGPAAIDKLYEHKLSAGTPKGIDAAGAVVVAMQDPNRLVVVDVVNPTVEILLDLGSNAPTSLNLVDEDSQNPTSNSFIVGGSGTVWRYQVDIQNKLLLKTTTKFSYDVSAVEPEGTAGWNGTSVILTQSNPPLNNGNLALANLMTQNTSASLNLVGLGFSAPFGLTLGQDRVFVTSSNPSTLIAFSMPFLAGAKPQNQKLLAGEVVGITGQRILNSEYVFVASNTATGPIVEARFQSSLILARQYSASGKISVIRASNVLGGSLFVATESPTMLCRFNIESGGAPAQCYNLGDVEKVTDMVVGGTLEDDPCGCSSQRVIVNLLAEK